MAGGVNVTLRLSVLYVKQSHHSGSQHDATDLLSDLKKNQAQTKIPWNTYFNVQCR